MISPTYVIYLQVLLLTLFNISIQTLEYWKLWPTTQQMNLPLNIPRNVIWLWPFLLLLTLISPDHSGWLLLLAFVFHLALCVRFKGTFNGGSDYMTSYTLLGLTLMGFFADSKFGLLWIATSLLLSYFIAGVIKVKEASWRSGQALEQFFNLNRSPLCPPQLNAIRPSKIQFKVLAWLVMIAEVLSPAVLWFPEAKFALMAFFAFFHFLNFWVFGLNRFFWAWIATYPALFVLPEL